ncbi:hypothetical protein BO94DRAFT_300670 [Aspergillus sclerotioniger CBS 115572]|uniref:Uncharacterized protein n=1 Tax=Aspergillus sclerotioniger CBS 115572 TaxID=1450535 RepID=A0A317V332_9EURO|nr:hypothetical protein BO94DRAFT_300670 [Aspergillus sclerotioniger CBS 115572]PWY68495.1 hypothetical protein BO94DRAFT_300670 [Aspergillus sclerotioniger CBS 115572]
MADGYSRLPGEPNAFYSSRNRSQTAVGVPPSTPTKRASSFYPNRPGIVDESNPDPFYLEHTLAGAAPWGTRRPGSRDARCSEEGYPYSMLSSVYSTDIPFAPTARGEATRLRSNINRSTLSVVELEHQLGLQQVAARPWGAPTVNHDHGSFSSVHTEATPDLTPSSSFSSNYSAPIYPENFPPSEPLPVPPPVPSPRNNVYPCSSTPLNQSQTTLCTQSSTPVRKGKPQTVAPNASSDTLVMHRVDSHDAPPHLGKPLPSLPHGAGSNIGHSGRKGPPPPIRPPIAPSMISPPSRINPVTMEPHASHFDQAMFIPANDCPSPVPSPGPSSPALERYPTANSGRDRPSTSASRAAYCEQSVWESDSDSETADPKSLSRKPMDTLKKVRSRVHLRVAKSAPKLQPTQAASQQTHPLEKYPSMPDQPPEELCPSPTRHTVKARSRDGLRNAPTLRLVDPSVTSLPLPQSRRGSGQVRAIDIDRTTAAAMQAKSRRRPRSESKRSLPPEREKVYTFCREDRSDAILSLARPPLYKRLWDSLRVLGCHGEIPPRSRRPM